MILPRCSLGFFPGMEMFVNGGPALNGQPIQDQSRYWSAINVLKWQMMLLPGDYLKGANGMDRKPSLYLVVKVVKYLVEEQSLCVDERKKEG